MSISYILLITFALITTRHTIFGLTDQLLYWHNYNQQTYFNLFTPESQLDPYIFNVDNASSITMYPNIRGSLPMKVIVHGWWKTDQAEALRDAFFRCGDYNVIIIDWTKGSDTIVVPIAELNIHFAAKALGKFLLILEENISLNMAAVELVGGDFGASVSGIAGSQIGNLSMIVGLDPTWSILARSLSREDAQYVQAIHSSVVYGTSSAVGDADFFLNGGVTQDVCDPTDTKCSHFFGGNLFILSLCKSPYTGCRRDVEGDCGYIMGGDPLQVYSGVFDVITNGYLYF